MFLCLDLWLKWCWWHGRLWAVAKPCLHRVRAFSFPHSVPLSKWAGSGWTAGRGTWLGQLTWTDRRDVLCHVTSCSVIKTVGRGRAWRGDCLETGWVLVCLWEVVSDCHCIYWFFLFVSFCVCCFSTPPPPPFFHLLNCLFLNPWVFLICSYSLLSQKGVIEWLCGRLATGWGQPSTLFELFTGFLVVL